MIVHKKVDIKFCFMTKHHVGVGISQNESFSLIHEWYFILEVNIDKTKIVVFRKGGVLR